MLLIISIIVFTVSLLIFIVNKGIPNSISESYYVLGEGKLISSLFTWFCWIVGGTLLPYWIDYLNTDIDLLPFVACGGLMFVGTATLFKGHEKKIHFISAIICFASTYIWLLLYSNIFLVLTSVLALVLTSVLANKKIFWLEVIAFVTIYIGLL